MTSARACACGCGASLAGRNARVKYAMESHRQRDYRRRLKRLAEQRGAVANLSFKALNGTNPTSDRSGDAPTPVKPRRAPTPGTVRVSYLRTRDAIAADLTRRYDASPLLGRVIAEEILKPLLTDHQRKALHG